MKIINYPLLNISWRIKIHKRIHVEFLNAFVRSLLRWTKRYEDENEIKRHNREPISYKVKKEHITFILKELKNNKTITIDDLLAKLSNKYSKLNTT